MNLLCLVVGPDVSTFWFKSINCNEHPVKNKQFFLKSCIREPLILSAVADSNTDAKHLKMLKNGLNWLEMVDGGGRGGDGWLMRGLGTDHLISGQYRGLTIL